jgi:hypothetical protein
MFSQKYLMKESAAPGTLASSGTLPEIPVSKKQKKI